MEITLTWDSTGDMDLHVIEPDGTHVYWLSPTGRTVRAGPDDSDGYGPETATISRGAAMAGTYQVYIVHFGRDVSTTATIQIHINRGTPSERSLTVVRSSGVSDLAVGINVADVNVLAGTITQRSGTRASDERSALLGGK